VRALPGLAALLAAITAVLGVVVIIHDLSLKHHSRTIETLGAGLLLIGVAVVAMVIEFSGGRGRV
jgi:hypothetical protein